MSQISQKRFDNNFASFTSRLLFILSVQRTFDLFSHLSSFWTPLWQPFFFFFFLINKLETHEEQNKFSIKLKYLFSEPALRLKLPY